MHTYIYSKLYIHVQNYIYIYTYAWGQKCLISKLREPDTDDLELHSLNCSRRFLITKQNQKQTIKIYNMYLARLKPPNIVSDQTPLRCHFTSQFYSLTTLDSL